MGFVILLCNMVVATAFLFWATKFCSRKYTVCPYRLVHVDRRDAAKSWWRWIRGTAHGVLVFYLAATFFLFCGIALIGAAIGHGIGGVR